MKPTASSDSANTRFLESIGWATHVEFPTPVPTSTAQKWDRLVQEFQPSRGSMNQGDTDIITECLRIEMEKKRLELAYGESQKRLKQLLERSKNKSCLRVVYGTSIVTLSASNGGKVVQVHVSELDGVIA